MVVVRASLGAFTYLLLGACAMRPAKYRQVIGRCFVRLSPRGYLRGCGPLLRANRYRLYLCSPSALFLRPSRQENAIESAVGVNLAARAWAHSSAPSP